MGGFNKLAGATGLLGILPMALSGTNPLKNPLSPIGMVSNMINPPDEKPKPKKKAGTIMER